MRTLPLWRKGRRVDAGNRLSQPANGASSQYAKVITALAALLQLGPDFRFTTTLETKGSLDGGVLKGDLIARFGGDPTLKRQDIRNMVATLKSWRAAYRRQCAYRYLRLRQP